MNSEPIDCASVLEHLLERDDETPASSKRAADCAAHLGQCSTCRAQAERLGLALAALRERAGDPVPTIDMWSRVRSTLAAEGRLAALDPAPALSPARPSGAARTRPRSSLLVRRASVLAAAAAAVALVWQLLVSLPPSTTADSALANTQAPATAPETVLVASPAGETLAPVRTLPLTGASELLPAPSSAGTSGGLRRAPGEERRRDFSVPFESATGVSTGSLASDRELR